LGQQVAAVREENEVGVSAAPQETENIRWDLASLVPEKWVKLKEDSWMILPNQRFAGPQDLRIKTIGIDLYYFEPPPPANKIAGYSVE
jgi:hypothetical protein